MDYDQALWLAGLLIGQCLLTRQSANLIVVIVSPSRLRAQGPLAGSKMGIMDGARCSDLCPVMIIFTLITRVSLNSDDHSLAGISAGCKVCCWGNMAIHEHWGAADDDSLEDLIKELGWRLLWASGTARWSSHNTQCITHIRPEMEINAEIYHVAAQM